MLFWFFFSKKEEDGRRSPVMGYLWSNTAGGDTLVSFFFFSDLGRRHWSLSALLRHHPERWGKPVKSFQPTVLNSDAHHSHVQPKTVRLSAVSNVSRSTPQRSVYLHTSLNSSTDHFFSTEYSGEANKKKYKESLPLIL